MGEMEEEDSVERVFRDISNATENLLSLNYKHAPALQKAGSNPERQLYDEKERLKRSGLKYADLEAKYRFLEGLKDENWPFDTKEAAREDEREKHSSVNEIVEDLENSTEKLADTLLTKYSGLKEKLNVIEKKLAASKTKKQELEILEEKSRKLASQLEQQKSSTNAIEELKQKQSAVSFAIKQCSAAVDSLEHCKVLLQSDLCRLQEHVDGLAREAKQQQLQSDSCTEMHKEAERCTEMVELLAALSGVMVKSVQADSVVLEIRTSLSSGAGLHVNGQAVELMIQFKTDTNSPQLAGAQINVNSFDIDDLAAEAQCRSDIVGLVEGVKSRLRSHQAMLAEIDELQTKYAADWEPTVGRVRVMLGTSGKIVCTLKLSPLQPHHVTLLGVEDTRVRTELPVADFQFIENPPSSLLGWIERLHEKFTPE